ncbi:MAG: WD40 repeat domain-containing protein [Burkholderiales bacterium]|nr:WD40 repeat domain-containing protein [Burkholderiales bacterium]
MTATAPDRLAVASRALGSHCVAVRVLEDGRPWFAAADGGVFIGIDERTAPVVAHDGLLAAVPAPEGPTLYSSGEDGRVCRLDCQSGAPATVTELGRVPRRWVGVLTANRAGAVAWASGNTAWVRDAGGGLREIRHARAIEALALSPTGLLLGIAAYDGLTLHALDDATVAPRVLPWPGVHAGITFSPDGRFVVSRLKDATLHAWRLADGSGMRMGVYPANVGDWAFSAGGRWLVTSGAGAAVAWPFEGEGGPMHQTALELGEPRESPVTAVACHPVEDIVAMGHADGCVRLAHLATGQQRVLRDATTDNIATGAVTALAWQHHGLSLAWGTHGGEGAVAFFPSTDSGDSRNFADATQESTA